MDENAVKRLALVLAVYAEIEGMKAQNLFATEHNQYQQHDFNAKAEELKSLAYAHEMQLFG